jgi:hypothetical protein
MNTSEVAVQTMTSADYGNTEILHEFEPNTRFIIVSPYESGGYTLMETGSVDNYKHCVRNFIIREIVSEFNTNKIHNHVPIIIPYALRVYAYTDDKPFDINTSKVIFSTNDKDAIRSINLPWDVTIRECNGDDEENQVIVNKTCAYEIVIVFK